MIFLKEMLALAQNRDYKSDPLFYGIEPFNKRVLLASPTMHKTADGNSWVELEYIREAFEENWVTCAGTNLRELEKMIKERIGVKHAAALSNCTSAIHLAVKLAALRLYGSSSGVSTPDGPGEGGCLYGRKVFCSDLTFGATVNPVLYEGGEPVFIDSEYETWNMDPDALEKAFEIYPDVKLVIAVHLYGTPCKIDRITEICKAHGALLIEDAAESIGALYKGKQTASFGDYSVLSFNGNKTITGSSGGALICKNGDDSAKAKKWSTQSREIAPWYEHEELGYNYRMSNVIAGIIRGQFEYLDEHISRKKEIYKTYKQGLTGLPVRMNPLGNSDSEGNCWLSCLLIDEDYMAETNRTETVATYEIESGKSCPTEILEALDAFNAEGRPIWKPMHMQPIYKGKNCVTALGLLGETDTSVACDIFRRGLCLPSDINMTPKEQETVIEIVRRCFA